MNYAINIKSSRANIISQLLKFEGQRFSKEVWFKKTNSNFKKAYGIELKDAPVIFVADKMIWKLSFIQSRHSSNLGGQRYEKAEYLPIVSCSDKFKRLERQDIFKKIYGKK